MRCHPQIRESVKSFEEISSASASASGGAESRILINPVIVDFEFDTRRRRRGWKVGGRWKLEMVCGMTSVTRLGDLLDFGQLFNAFGNNLFAQIFHILRQFLNRCLNLSLF